MLQSFQPPWWKRAVIYQVYPRSFTDSDGDLPGLVARLDHLRRLGGDALWPSPVYRSPDPGAAAADRDVGDRRQPPAPIEGRGLAGQ